MTQIFINNVNTKSYRVFLAFGVSLLAIFNMGIGMASTKSEIVEFTFSSKKISFSSPVNYSKDYPAPQEKKYTINLYDKDLYKKDYTKSVKSFGIRKAYWDYGRGIIFGGVKGTLSMMTGLYSSSQNVALLKENRFFLESLQKNLEQVYDEQAREDYTVVLPEKYQFKNISNIDWAFYEYSIGGKKIVAYAYPLDEQHYLKIEFDFIDNSEGQKNNWKEQAQDTVDFIMSSFEVK